jgi:hypothetical protein
MLNHQITNLFSIIVVISWIGIAQAGRTSVVTPDIIHHGELEMRMTID